jgi:hypothetical protein
VHRCAHLRTFLQSALLAGLLAAVPLLAAGNQKDANKDTYDQDSILKDAADFFGRNAEGLAKVIEKAFKDHGRPNAYIKGQEASGAITVGLRYGDGTLTSERGRKQTTLEEWASTISSATR